VGTEITEQNSSSLDIKCRTAQALAAVGKLCSVWKSRHISKVTKFRLMDFLVIPIALYGCETWTLNKADRKKLQSFETKSLRKILGVTCRERVTNKEILARSSRDAGHLLKNVLLRQRKWLGHVLRMQGQRLPKMSLQAHHIGPRRRGRPRKKSSGCIGRQRDHFEAGVHLAHDREMWRNCIYGAYDH
jgi:hypothetical protein